MTRSKNCDATLRSSRTGTRTSAAATLSYTDAMKRDMKLIKEILEDVEKHQDVAGAELDVLDLEMRVAEGRYGMDISELPDENQPLHGIHHHVWLCVNAGFVEGQVPLSPTLWASSYVKALTWKGHDVLEELRGEDGRFPLAPL